MIKFYSITRKVESRSIVEIEEKTSTIDIKSLLFQYLLVSTKKRLPDDFSFSVVKGKRWTDVIYMHEAASRKFYSQTLIDVLGLFIDLTDKCYPINIIEGAPCNYYMIYNLKEFPLYKDPNNVLSRYFEITTDYPSLFTIKDSNFCICTLEVKQAIEKMKISNVEFNEIYGLTKDECDALGLQLWEKNM